MRVGKGFGQLDLALTTPAAEDDRVTILNASSWCAICLLKYDGIERVICLSFCVQLSYRFCKGPGAVQGFR